MEHKLLPHYKLVLSADYSYLLLTPLEIAGKMKDVQMGSFSSYNITTPFSFFTYSFDSGGL